MFVPFGDGDFIVSETIGQMRISVCTAITLLVILRIQYIFYLMLIYSELCFFTKIPKK